MRRQGSYKSQPITNTKCNLTVAMSPTYQCSGAQGSPRWSKQTESDAYEPTKQIAEVNSRAKQLQEWLISCIVILCMPSGYKPGWTMTILIVVTFSFNYTWHSNRKTFIKENKVHRKSNCLRFSITIPDRSGVYMLRSAVGMTHVLKRACDGLCGL